MTTMKIDLVFALAAALVAAPLVAAPAAAAKDKDAPAAKEAKAPAAKDAKADEAAGENEGPTPEQLKARKVKKPIYPKFVDAKNMAEKCGQPMIVAVVPANSPHAATLKKVLTHKAIKDFVLKNCILVQWALKVDGKDPKRIELRGLKEPEVKFLENYGVTERMISQAKQYNRPEPKFTDTSCYPAILCVDPTAQKELFRVNLSTFNKDSGIGEWISAIVEEFRAKANENPELSPLLNKILENPDEPKKWK